MKKLFIALLVLVLMAAFAVPALAQDGPLGQDPDVCDVSFDVDVLKDKTISITKTVNKNFNFDLELVVFIEGSPGWAEVEVFKCDLNEDNMAAVSGIFPTNSISTSFIGFIGIAQVNQAAGFMNNQGNVVAAGSTGQAGFGLSLVEAAVEKTNRDNELLIDGSTFSDNIEGSFSSFQGIGQVNQASGLMNNQNNVIALGTNLETTGLVAENDTFLSLVITDNQLAVANTTTTANIENSFNGYIGGAQVNQSPGSENNQANIISISRAGP